MSSDFYFQRFGFCGRQIAASPPSNLGLVVVIPCFNEPDLIGSLESLWLCERPACAVEVIVVVNSPSNCDAKILRQNLITLEQASAWAANHRDERLAFHFLHFPDLPPKQSGVGLARKIGMDEALRRFDDLGKPREGIIIGFDADCRCAPNYLTAIERHFKKHPHTPGCSIYFEHPLDGPLASPVYEAVAAYELHLRYYVQALRYAGFPYAHHTIGSCMAVRAEVYRKQGGMNKRQAGEDFYFLHKVMPLGGFTDLNDTTVYPSPRASKRVPFGTGKAVQSCLDGKPITTYPLEAFTDLKGWLEQLPAIYQNASLSVVEQCKNMPESMRTFLAAQGFAAALAEIRQHTASEAAFHKRFFHWFNGFQAMKFIHHARDQFYGVRDVDQEAANLLSLMPESNRPATALSVCELLAIYRGLDRRPQQWGGSLV